jgi:hypothetical protein
MQARWQMVQQARNGGSLTPEMMTHLRAPRLIALLRIRGAQNPYNLVAILNKICIFRGALTTT